MDFPVPSGEWTLGIGQRLVQPSGAAHRYCGLRVYYTGDGSGLSSQGAGAFQRDAEAFLVETMRRGWTVNPHLASRVAISFPLTPSLGEARRRSEARAGYHG